MPRGLLTEADHLAEQPQGAEGPAAVAAAVEPMVAPVAAPVSAVGAFAHDVVVFGLPSPEAELELGKVASVLLASSSRSFMKIERPAAGLLTCIPPLKLRTSPPKLHNLRRESRNGGVVWLLALQV